MKTGAELGFRPFTGSAPATGPVRGEHAGSVHERAADATAARSLPTTNNHQTRAHSRASGRLLSPHPRRHARVGALPLDGLLLRTAGEVSQVRVNPRDFGKVAV